MNNSNDVERNKNNRIHVISVSNKLESATGIVHCRTRHVITSTYVGEQGPVKHKNLTRP